MSPRSTQQSLAADGATACFSSNLLPFSLNADRAPQLKANVRPLLLRDDMKLALNPHEELFARSFVYPAQRERYLALLESKRGRKKLCDGLNHAPHLDGRFAKSIPSNQQSAESIERLLRSKGAPDLCHVMSANSEIDNRDMLLTKALLETIGMDAGTMISCIPGKLAYVELEGFDGRYILER